jgi:oligopeptide/dipeptide ABC transporter ATP-binding protein
MYAGLVVEDSDAMRFFEKPLHPYSQMLMASVPRLRGDKEPEFITGQPPSLYNLPPGCRFADRCPLRFSACDQDPYLVDIEGRRVSCWKYV